MIEEEGHARLHVRAIAQVVVVEHDGEVVGHNAQLVEELSQGRVDAGRQQLERARSGPRGHPLDRCEEVGPEGRRVPVLFAQRHPREPAQRGSPREPGSHQGGLAVPGRSRDQRERRPVTCIEKILQLGARHRPRHVPRQPQFALEYRAQRGCHAPLHRAVPSVRNHAAPDSLPARAGPAATGDPAPPHD
jgi:hypothetical protein